MIVERVLTLFISAMKGCFGFINFPDMPAEITSVLDMIYNAVVSGASFIGLFCHISLLRIMIPLVIIVMNFDHIYRLTMFILRKIPFVGIE